MKNFYFLIISAVLIFYTSHIWSFTISGYTLDTGSSPINGASAMFWDMTNGIFASTKTNVSGYFEFTNISTVTCSVSVMKTGFLFINPSVTFSPLQQDTTGLIFWGYITSGSSTITGLLLDCSGAGIDNVTVKLERQDIPYTSQQNTGTGSYSFENIASATYIITPAKPGYDFYPSSAVLYDIPDGVTVQNFTGAGQWSPLLVVETSTLDLGRVDPDVKICEGSFRIWNSSGGILTGTITSDSDWLTVGNPLFEALQPVEINVLASISKQLTVGKHTGMISIISNGGNADITVTLEMTCVLTKPNPWNPSCGPLVFFGSGIVPGMTTIRIYTLSGMLVPDVLMQIGIKPDEIVLTDDLSPGIYLYTYESPAEKGTGKFTCIR